MGSSDPIFRSRRCGWHYATPRRGVLLFRNRNGGHPTRRLAGYAGILQADAYGGFNCLYEPKRSSAPINEAACWSHGPWKFFVLADIARSSPGREQRAPLAVAAVRRIHAIFAIESEINGLPAAQRLAIRTTRIAPVVTEFA